MIEVNDENPARPGGTARAIARRLGMES